ncbi:ATP-binding protein [Streptomyces sp. NPDC003077]|uniref:ATP-binding protein n=1 Tax=Streptomyces sp. NPDC003077 TaxID=3154443 RepID=UPI0033A86C50
MTPAHDRLPLPPRTYQRAFTPTPHSLRDVRRTVREYLDRWGLGDLTPEACLVVTELLSNVHKHAGGKEGAQCTLALREMPGGVEIVVSDSSSTLPEIKEPELYSDSGRGLALILHVARRLEIVPTDTGKDIRVVLISVPSEGPAAEQELPSQKQVGAAPGVSELLH